MFVPHLKGCVHNLVVGLQSHLTLPAGLSALPEAPTGIKWIKEYQVPKLSGDITGKLD